MRRDMPFNFFRREAPAPQAPVAEAPQLEISPEELTKKQLEAFFVKELNQAILESNDIKDEPGTVMEDGQEIRLSASQRIAREISDMLLSKLGVSNPSIYFNTASLEGLVRVRLQHLEGATNGHIKEFDQQVGPISHQLTNILVDSGSQFSIPGA